MTGLDAFLREQKQHQPLQPEEGPKQQAALLLSELCRGGSGLWGSHQAALQHCPTGRFAWSRAGFQAGIQCCP